eukprot:scaffold32045_cov29-Tisochrysis_lutea.AAC.3
MGRATARLRLPSWLRRRLVMRNSRGMKRSIYATRSTPSLPIAIAPLRAEAGEPRRGEGSRPALRSDATLSSARATPEGTGRGEAREPNTGRGRSIPSASKASRLGAGAWGWGF